jgi:hypothetical protein
VIGVLKSGLMAICLLPQFSYMLFRNCETCFQRRELDLGVDCSFDSTNTFSQLCVSV